MKQWFWFSKLIALGMVRVKLHLTLYLTYILWRVYSFTVSSQLTFINEAINTTILNMHLEYFFPCIFIVVILKYPLNPLLRFFFPLCIWTSICNRLFDLRIPLYLVKKYLPGEMGEKKINKNHFQFCSEALARFLWMQVIGSFGKLHVREITAFQKEPEWHRFGQSATRIIHYWIKKNVPATLTDEIRYCNLTPNFPTLL